MSKSSQTGRLRTIEAAIAVNGFLPDNIIAT